MTDVTPRSLDLDIPLGIHSSLSITIMQLGVRFTNHCHSHRGPDKRYRRIFCRLKFLGVG